MRILRNKWFSRFARKENIADASLVEAIWRAERGQIDADLGSGLIKLRLARSGEGRSGGYRTIVAYRSAEKAFFLYGFAKNEQGNISTADLLLLRKAAKNYLQVNETGLRSLTQDGELQEVAVNDQGL